MLNYLIILSVFITLKFYASLTSVYIYAQNSEFYCSKIASHPFQIITLKWLIGVLDSALSKGQIFHPLSGTVPNIGSSLNYSHQSPKIFTRIFIFRYFEDNVPGIVPNR